MSLSARTAINSTIREDDFWMELVDTGHQLSAKNILGMWRHMNSSIYDIFVDIGFMDRFGRFVPNLTEDFIITTLQNRADLEGDRFDSVEQMAYIFYNMISAKITDEENWLSVYPKSLAIIPLVDACETLVLAAHPWSAMRTCAMLYRIRAKEGMNFSVALASLQKLSVETSWSPAQKRTTLSISMENPYGNRCKLNIRANSKALEDFLTEYSRELDKETGFKCIDSTLLHIGFHRTQRAKHKLLLGISYLKGRELNDPLNA